MVKQYTVGPYHRILHSNKKEPTIDTHNNFDESSENYAERKKPIPKDYIMYDPIHDILEMKICRSREQTSSCQG